MGCQQQLLKKTATKMPAVGWATPILTLLLASAAGLAAGAATIHVSAPTGPGSDTAETGADRHDKAEAETGPMPSQRTIPRIEALPNQPDHWSLIGFKSKAEQLHHWLFDANTPALGTSVVHNVSLTSAWYNGSAVSMPSYLGEQIHGAGEGLAVIGSVYGSAVLGQTDFPVPAEFITVYADPSGIVWNNPSGMQPHATPTFWVIQRYFLDLSCLRLANPGKHHLSMG